MNFYAKKIVKGASIIFVFTLLVGLFQFLTKILFTRLYTPEEIGLFFAVLSMVAFISLFKDFGMNKAVQKFIPEYLVKKQHDKINFMIWFNVIFSIATSVIIGLIIFLLADFLALNYFENSLAKPIIIMLVFWLGIAKLELVLVKIQFSFSKVFLSQIIPTIESLVILILLPTLAFMGLAGVAWAYIASVVVALGVAIYTSPREYYKKIPKWQPKEAKKYIKFSLPLMLSEVMVKPAKYFDILFLTYLRPLSEVGVFTIVYWLPMVVLRFAGSFSKIMLPTTSELIAKKMKKQLNENLQNMYKYLVWVMVPVAAIFVVYAKEIILLLYGTEYVTGSIVVQLIAIGVIFNSISIINISVINGAGHSGTVAKITILSSVLNIILNLILIPLYGIAGAGATTLFQYLIVFLYTQHKTKKSVNTSFPWKEGTIIVLGGVSFWVVAYLISLIGLNMWVSIPIALILGGVSYLLVTMLTKTITLKEVKQMIKLVL